jgi:hypothetical protein
VSAAGAGRGGPAHAFVFAGAFLATLVGLAAAGGRAAAHTSTATFSDVVVDGDDVTWSLRARVADLVGTEVGAGLAPGADVAAALGRAGALEDVLARGLHVERGGAGCVVGERALGADTDAATPSVTARFRFVCPQAGVLTLRYELFFAFDPLHTGYAKVAVGDGESTTHVFRAGARAVSPGGSTSSAGSPWRSAREYLALGVAHIFTGIDHLFFLAALLLATGLAARSRAGLPARANEIRPALREVLKIVTAFTAAHSLTLILSTLRPGLIGTRWVEPAIAASIVYVGVENLVPRTPRRRWVLVFAFGLVHGLGFSSVLREIGLPARGLVLSLLALRSVSSRSSRSCCRSSSSSRVARPWRSSGAGSASARRRSRSRGSPGSSPACGDAAYARVAPLTTPRGRANWCGARRWRTLGR